MKDWFGKARHRRRVSSNGSAGDGHDDRARRLIEEIAAEMRMIAAETGEPDLDARVAAALLQVPRDAFVPPHQVELAYANRPLPIGHGQTISQPVIVALMTQLLHVGPGAKVLEVGTGSGYQAAVLAALGAEVFTVETIPELAETARRRLADLGYEQVHVRCGDGSLGWPEEAPFDAIIVTAGGARVPKPLIGQLRPGGRMVIPVGGFGFQNLKVIEKTENGGIVSRNVLPVAFVPLVGSGVAASDVPKARWEHFEHGADVGLRGVGASLAEAFEQVGLALTAVVTDPARVQAETEVAIACEAPDREQLLIDWLNALIYEMATRRMLFARYAVEIDGRRLSGRAWGEPVDVSRHAPAVEPKGATFTELFVGRRDGQWVAQCVVDV